jgi:hypothetical protein
MKDMKKYLKLFGFLLVLALFIMGQTSCSKCSGASTGDVINPAKVYYVSPTGSNSNPGTLAKPWATPGYGSRQLRPGDTLIILGGRYILSQYDDDIIIPQYSGNPNAWITIKGEEGNRPVLAGRDNLLTAIDISGKSYVRIENLEITSDNRSQFRDGIEAFGESISNIVIKDVYIHHIDEFGMNIEDVNGLQIIDSQITYCGFGAIGGPAGDGGGWRNVSILGCNLSYSGHYYQGTPGPGPYDRPDGFGIEASNGPIEIAYTIAEHNRGDGLDSKAANTHIHHCIVANNSCDGVKLWGNNSKVENTLIYGRGDGDTTETPWSPIVISTETSNSNFEIINVTVDDFVGRNYLMHVQYDYQSIPVNLTLRNTIFRGIGENSPIFVSAGTNLTADHNLFYTPKSEFVLDYGGTIYNANNINSLGSGNLYRDPLFVNPAFGTTGDYHLRNGSPAIDNGSSTDAPTDDLDGNPRPQGAGFDIGAYER